MLYIACDEGLWDISKFYIEKFAEYLLVAIPAKSSLFNVLFIFIKDILKCDDETTLLKVLKRICRMKEQGKFASTLLLCDEAMQVMDQQDHERFNTEMKHARNTIQEVNDLLLLYKEKRTSMKGKGKGKGGVKYPKKMGGNVHHITQAEGKAYIPDGASLWQGVTRGEWWGHFPPFSRVYSSVADHGPEGAFYKVLQGLWKQYNFVWALPEASCPIAGVFEFEFDE